MMGEEHQPVLLEEVLAGLNIKPDGRYVDLTFGRGGHSQRILQQLGPEGRLLALDRDPVAIGVAKQEGPFRDPRFSIEHSEFSQLSHVVEKYGWKGQVDGILMDLGVSSPQLDDPARGFSFQKDGPLDMRMNPKVGIDAATWINQAELYEIIRVLREYGQEKKALRIAKAIVRQRAVKPFLTTLDLADFVSQVSPNYKEKKHPATRTFQAIRIFINQELEELQSALKQSLEVMAVHGRMCVISFHSLEDRLVKQFIYEQAERDPYPVDFPVRAADIHHRMRKVGALIRSSDDEVVGNVRSRSARLRVAEKLA